MTALAQYETLEATALWRETLATQRREVIVSFGDTSLMIRDARDQPLSHWSLAAVTRLNPGAWPALFAPNAEANESLEISDEVMVEAIEKITAAIDRKRPHPGRLRLVILLLIGLTIGGLAVFWLPGALVRHTISVVPPEVRREIGRKLQAEINLLAGRNCETRLGQRAISTLRARLLPNETAEILIIKGGVTNSVLLPGQVFLLSSNLVEDFETPAVLAGYILLEKVAARAVDPLANLLADAGVRESFRLLTTGQISREALADHAQNLLTRTPQIPDEKALLTAFGKAGFSSAPLAYAIDYSGEKTLGLIEADPYRNSGYAPLLSDSDWVGLQEICGD